MPHSYKNSIISYIQSFWPYVKDIYHNFYPINYVFNENVSRLYSTSPHYQEYLKLKILMILS